MTRHLVPVSIYLSLLLSCNSPKEYKSFDEYPSYEGDDLELFYSPTKSVFTLWAPTAEEVRLNLYASGEGGEPIRQLPMKSSDKGTWRISVSEDLKGSFYTFQIRIGDKWLDETPGIWAKAVGVNGNRAAVIDWAATDPEGWEADKSPELKSFSDIIIYEMHHRDFSIAANSGVTHKGKFLALAENGTKGPGGVATGVDHLKELGVTHVHILPSYDYGSVDETRLQDNVYNWGYDPKNYNAPEGSYSTDPYNGAVRVAEMKQMVKALHDNQISVIMDVVYNHVYNASDFCVNQIVPGYFSRVNEDGTYSNGSDCGNDTASERSMVRKYIVDSVKYWADEYHIDGFRFDLVGLIDTETINEVVTEVHKTHPDVIFYGEGWTMDTAVTKDGYKMTTQPNSTDVPGFAFFSDTLRDALKGHVFYTTRKGYVSGAADLADTVKGCFLGQADDWCTTPSQSINYASCHDNMTLLDRITKSTPGASEEDHIRMNNLSAAIYMTAQGIPFLQAGEEMLRAKIDASGDFVENSYNSPDSVNSIKWDTLEDETYQNVYHYYKGLIAFRKAHAALRLTNADDVNANITSVDGLDENVLAFRINGGVNGETSDGIFVIFNPNNAATSVTLPDGAWDVCVDADHAGTEALTTVSGSVSVEPISAMVLVKKES